MINDGFMFVLLTYVFQLRLVLFMLTVVGCMFCVIVVYVACSTSAGDNDDNAHTKAAHAKSAYLATYVADTHNSVLHLFYVIGSNVINYHLLHNTDTSISCDAKFGSRKLQIIVLMHYVCNAASKFAQTVTF
jgi:hypothetical protein